jgi:hypothetical protein
MPDTKKEPTNKSDTQSVLFDVNKWTITKAKQWLKEHDYTGLKVDTSENYYRFRQINPDKFKRMVTQKLSGGIKLIIGFKNKKTKLYKTEIDFEVIDDYMNERGYEDDIKSHVLGMISGFSLNDLSKMVEVFNRLISDVWNVKLIKKDMNDYKINFDNLNDYMDIQGFSNEIKSLIPELLENFQVTELLNITEVLDKIRWNIQDKMWAEEREIQNNFEHKPFLKSENANIKGKVKLIKESANTEKRLVYGVVIEPELIDTDNQWTDEKNIENACHTYMKKFREKGINHEETVGDEFILIENYIAPSNFIINKVLIKKGSWVQGYYVADDDIWEQIKTGDLDGFSFEGIGMLIDKKPGEDN